MKMSSIILILVLCVFGIVQTVQAVPKTVTLTAVKDCEVKAFAPTTAFPSDADVQGLKTTTLGNNTAWFAQFALPADCNKASDITELTWKNVVSVAPAASDAYYILGILQAAETAAGDLNAYTWNTAPAIDRSATPATGLQYNVAEARACKYSAYTGTVGAESTAVINATIGGSYWTNTSLVLSQDTDRLLTFYFHERYAQADCCHFASIENGTYHGPQLEITYEPLVLDKGLIVDTSSTANAQEEGPVAATYDVSLSVEPDANVTVSFSYDSDLVSVSPASLTFTAGDYDTPQPVTVTPIDDYVARGVTYTAVVTNTPSSAGDTGYDTADPVDATITIEDNEYKTITLTATKDCMVRADDPNTAFPSDPNISSYKNTIGDQAYFLWQFELPADCLASNIVADNFTFKLTLEEQKVTSSRGTYLYYIREADDNAAGDLNAYTFGTAPGINKAVTPAGEGTTPVDTVATYLAGYEALTVTTPGAKWSYTPTANYLTSLQNSILPNDTDGKLTFLCIPRDIHTEGDHWASIENATYDGPQITITYEPLLFSSGLVIDTSETANAEEEGPVAATYKVSLTNEPTANVTVSFEYDTDLVASVSPSTLTFTSGDYDTPQPVTVTPVDDGIALDMVYETTVRNIATSTDLDYEFAPIVDVVINIEDNDYKYVVLTATADTDVNSLSPDTVFSSLPEIAPMKADSPTEYVYTYMQFELPSDFVYALGGTKLKITRTYISPRVDSTVMYLAGIRATNTDTGEPIVEGDVDTYTWNTAPGLELVPNPATAGTFSGYESDEAVFVANVAPSASGSVGDDLYITGSNVTEPMRNFINAHHGGDKKITLFILNRYLYRDINRFASIENSTYDGPQIELVYGTTPYCGQPGTVIAAGDINGDCDVDIDDLRDIAGQWLNDTSD